MSGSTLNQPSLIPPCSQTDKQSRSHWTQDGPVCLDIAPSFSEQQLTPLQKGVPSPPCSFPCAALDAASSLSGASFQHLVESDVRAQDRRVGGVHSPDAALSEAPSPYVVALFDSGLWPRHYTVWLCLGNCVPFVCIFLYGFWTDLGNVCVCRSTHVYMHTHVHICVNTYDVYTCVCTHAYTHTPSFHTDIANSTPASQGSFQFPSFIFAPSTGLRTLALRVLEMYASAQPLLCTRSPDPAFPRPPVRALSSRKQSPMSFTASAQLPSPPA